jgi:hypothetical protein
MQGTHIPVVGFCRCWAMLRQGVRVTMSSWLVHTAASRGIQPSQSRGLLRFEQPLVCAMGSVVVGDITHLSHPFEHTDVSCRMPLDGLPSLSKALYFKGTAALSCHECPCFIAGPFVLVPTGPHLVPTVSPPGPQLVPAPAGLHLVPTWWSPRGPHLAPPGPHRVPTGPHLVPTVSPPGHHMVPVPVGPHAVPTWSLPDRPTNLFFDPRI